MESKAVRRFFAVCLNSIYHVRVKKNGPEMEKIFERSRGSIKIGRVMSGPMLAIANQLQLYNPEGAGTYPRRDLENVNSRYWLGHTSNIVALCKTRTRALEIARNADLEACDSRWLEETKAVISEIGEQHPCISICHWGHRQLLPREEDKAGA